MTSVSISSTAYSLLYGESFVIEVLVESDDLEYKSYRVWGDGSMSHVSESQSDIRSYKKDRYTYWAQNGTLGSGTIYVEVLSEASSVIASDSIGMSVSQNVIYVSPPEQTCDTFNYNGGYWNFLDYIDRDQYRTHPTSDSENSGRNRRTYTIKIAIDDGDEYYRFEWTTGGTGTYTFYATIIKGNQSVSYPTIAASYSYTGRNVQLIQSPGSANHGTVQYALSNANWTNTYTNIVGKATGTYYIWMRVISNDDDYNDWGARQIAVTTIVNTAYSKIYVLTESGYKVAYPYTLAEMNGATYVWKKVTGYALDNTGWHKLNNHGG